MSDRRSIQELVQLISDAHREFDELAFDEVLQHEKGVPASTRDIAKLEDRVGQYLPRSYREFLELHNGWLEFVSGGDLLSTDQQEAEWLLREVGSWSRLWNSPDPDPFERGAIPIMFGEDISYFVVLDPTRPNENGEPSFVEYDNMAELANYGDFADYLESELRARRGAIERLRHGEPGDNPDSLGA